MKFKSAKANESHCWREERRLKSFPGGCVCFVLICLFLISEPDKVYNLRVSGNTKESILVNWAQPVGNFTDILVVANYTNGTYVFVEIQPHCMHTHFSLSRVHVRTTFCTPLIYWLTYRKFAKNKIIIYTYVACCVVWSFRFLCCLSCPAFVFLRDHLQKCPKCWL